MQRPNIDEVATRLRQVSAAQGFNAFLGCEVLRVAAGEVDLSVALRPDLTQHHGFAHGAVVGALADDACAWAAATMLGDVVTSSYSIHFLAPGQGARLRAEGRVLRAGRRQATVEARVYAEADGAEPLLVAVALGTVAGVGEPAR